MEPTESQELLKNGYSYSIAASQQEDIIGLLKQPRCLPWISESFNPTIAPHLTFEVANADVLSWNCKQWTTVWVAQIWMDLKLWKLWGWPNTYEDRAWKSGEEKHSNAKL